MKAIRRKDQKPPFQYIQLPENVDKILWFHTIKEKNRLQENREPIMREDDLLALGADSPRDHADGGCSRQRGLMASFEALGVTYQASFDLIPSLYKRVWRWLSPQTNLPALHSRWTRKKSRGVWEASWNSTATVSLQRAAKQTWMVGTYITLLHSLNRQITATVCCSSGWTERTGRQFAIANWAFE